MTAEERISQLEAENVEIILCKTNFWVIDTSYWKRWGSRNEDTASPISTNTNYLNKNIVSEQLRLITLSKFALILLRVFEEAVVWLVSSCATIR
jgi:hypothetical protein